MSYTLPYAVDCLFSAVLWHGPLPIGVDCEPSTMGAGVMQGILRGVLDRNKHVQEAACSALATLEEAAGPHLEARLQVA